VGNTQPVNYPNSLQVSLSIIAVIALLGLYLNSFVFAGVFFGTLLGHVLGHILLGGIDKKYVMSIYLGTFSIALLSGGGLIGLLISEHKISIIGQVVYAILLSIFIIGMAVSLFVGKTAKKRSGAIGIALSLVMFPALLLIPFTIRALSFSEVILLIFCTWVSFGAQVKTQLLMHYKDKISETLFPFQAVPRARLIVCLYDVLIWGGLLAILSVYRTQQLPINQQIVGSQYNHTSTSNV
jgi:hypothetical protein